MKSSALAIIIGLMLGLAVSHAACNPPPCPDTHVRGLYRAMHGSAEPDYAVNLTDTELVETYTRNGRAFRVTYRLSF